MMRNATAENILEWFRNATNHPDGALVPYRKFSIGGNTYFFTHGGFLYSKDLVTKEVGDASVATLPTSSGITGSTMDNQEYLSDYLTWRLVPGRGYDS